MTSVVLQCTKNFKKYIFTLLFAVALTLTYKLLLHSTTLFF